MTEISPGEYYIIAVSIMYLVEYRGFMGTLTGFATSIGFVVASGVGLPQVLGNAQSWHWTYILGTAHLHYTLTIFRVPSYGCAHYCTTLIPIRLTSA